MPQYIENHDAKQSILEFLGGDEIEGDVEGKNSRFYGTVSTQ